MMLTSHPCFYPGVCALQADAYFSFSHAVCVTKSNVNLVATSLYCTTGSLRGLKLICRAALLGEAQTRYICTTEEIIIGNERGKRITSCTV